MPEPLSTVACGTALIYVLARPASAQSDAANHLRVVASGLVDQREQSAALNGAKARVISDLLELARTHAEVGWDGEQAWPVRQAAIKQAIAFVRVLPDRFQMPEAAVEPDGAVSLDWLPSRHRMLSVSLEGNSTRLAYAWIDGVNRGHGVAVFAGDQIPRRLMDAIAATVEPVHHAVLRIA